MPSVERMPGRTPRRLVSRLRTLAFPRLTVPIASPHRHARRSCFVLALLLCSLLPGYVAAAPLAENSAAAASEDAAAIARRLIGAAYRYGGAGPRSFDCSGLTMYVYGQVGVGLPHNAAAQYNAPGQRIGSLADLAPGDLVFFVRTTGRRGITHAAIYVGDGQMVSANTPRTGVQLNSIHNGYWSSRFAGGLRIQRYKRGVIGG